MSVCLSLCLSFFFCMLACPHPHTTACINTTTHLGGGAQLQVVHADGALALRGGEEQGQLDMYLLIIHTCGTS